MRMRRKPWTEPKLAACPYFIEQPAEHRGRWRECFANPQLPLHLEIGCGKGVSTVKMAHENPRVNYVAIDEVRHVLAVSVSNTEREFGGDSPGNLVYSAVDAMRIYDSFGAADGIERIYISFPNPWDERAKHHKRRLTHPRQLYQYREFLAPGGEIGFNIVQGIEILTILPVGTSAAFKVNPGQAFVRFNFIDLQYTHLAAGRRMCPAAGNAVRRRFRRISDCNDGNVFIKSQRFSQWHHSGFIPRWEIVDAHGQILPDDSVCFRLCGFRHFPGHSIIAAGRIFRETDVDRYEIGTHVKAFVNSTIQSVDGAGEDVFAKVALHVVKTMFPVD